MGECTKILGKRQTKEKVRKVRKIKEGDNRERNEQ